MNTHTNGIFWLLLISSMLILSCTDDKINGDHASQKKVTNAAFKIFSEIPAKQSGLNFENTIIETEYYNHVLQDVIFNGGGIGVLDVNNDGLQDVFFCGNQVKDKIYLNQGNLKFKDITATSGIDNDTWSSSVSIVDINSDGYDDIYIGKYLYADKNKRHNLLYINNKDNTFSEKGKEYGIADDGFTTATNFFDIDNDGDLDLFVGNQPYILDHKRKGQIPDDIPAIEMSDILYRNNGNGSFTDITKSAGMVSFNFTLSATAVDMNNDGLMDLYVASDYEEPDLFYNNNGDGTFSNIANTALRHMSNFSMGVDLADINNDGYTDLFSADMAPADNFRQKANMSGMNPEKFWNLVKGGYHYQYMFNTLQLNNGNGTFSDIAQMAGVAKTDWSWATLFADLDNDGNKDLFISNGQVKDLTNKDYINRRTLLFDSLSKVQGGKKLKIDPNQYLNLAPSKKLRNYTYRNNGDLTFEDKSATWGIEHEGWSFGTVYADFDNDGDLEIMTSNINDPISLYKNMSQENELHNYLSFTIIGDQKNTKSIGARVYVYHEDGSFQFQEISPSRGFQSYNDPRIHFGLGNNKKVKEVIVKWPNGKTIHSLNVEANQSLTFREKDAKNNQWTIPSPKTIFSDFTRNSGFNFKHEENEFDDYLNEVLLPYKLSHLGPTIAKGDVNGDGLIDLYCGGAKGQPSEIFIQNKTGQYTKLKNKVFTKDKNSEDLGAQLIDIDNDNDLDLIVASGGNEFTNGSNDLKDRLYINNGNGQFQIENSFPSQKTSSAAIAAADYDNDGFVDVFIGGRNMPGKYGTSGSSYFLKNNNGTFETANDKFEDDLNDLGMITDAAWTDIDKDGDLDLIVGGEFMPITIFKNENNQLKKSQPIKDSEGLWNTIEIVDIDSDGDMDLIGGNLGRNYKIQVTKEKPFELFVKDFDDNGTNDVYLGYYDKDGICYPVRGRQCSSEQMPFVKKEFKDYTTFATASLDEVLSDRKEGAIHKQAKVIETSLFINDGNGNFTTKPLPNLAQISPTYGITCEDFNADGKTDIFLVGNYYQREVETTRSDAGNGVILLANGDHTFEPLMPYESGIMAIADARAALSFKDANDKTSIVIANNDNFFQIYKLK